MELFAEISCSIEAIVAKQCRETLNRYLEYYIRLGSYDNKLALVDPVVGPVRDILHHFTINVITESDLRCKTVNSPFSQDQET